VEPHDTRRWPSPQNKRIDINLPLQKYLGCGSRSSTLRDVEGHTLARARDALKNSVDVLESDGLYIHKWDPAIRVVAAAHQTCPNASAEYEWSVCCYNYRDPPMLFIDIVAQRMLLLPHWTLLIRYHYHLAPKI
jgi:hypothetical protein